MSNANEEIEMTEKDEKAVRDLIDVMYVMAQVKSPITVATACANFLVGIISRLPTHAQEGAVEALMKDIREGIEARNKARSSEGL